MKRHPFTFTEVLAAMVVVALIVPVAVRGISLARQLAGDDVRYELAARLADEKLNELIATGEWENGDTEGTFDEGTDEDANYTWALTSDSFDDDGELALTVLTMTVSRTSAARPVSVTLTALVTSTTTEEE